MSQDGIYKKLVKQVWGKNRKKVNSRPKQKQIDRISIEVIVEPKEDNKGEKNGKE